MKFASTHIFIYLCILAGVLVFFGLAQRAYRRALARFADAKLLVHVLPAADVRRRRIAQLCSVLGFCFLMLAAMRPQWGFKWEEVHRKGLDIMVALDTSKSMLAADVLPSRLSRSKLALRDFLRQLHGDRIGLVAFAGTAFTQCPLTLDYGGFMLSLDELDVATIPRGGTSLTSAIEEARNAFRSGAQDKILIIITDGEDHEGNALQAAQEAYKEGVHVYTIGIGTTEGDLVTIEDAGGQAGYVRDGAGNVVKSRLNEALLKDIALATEGSYIHSGATEFGLELLYKEQLSKFEKQDFTSKRSKRYSERFQIPLAIALLFFVAELWVGRI